MNTCNAAMVSGNRMYFKLATAVFIVALGTAVKADDAVPTDDIAKSHASLTQAVADAQKQFDSLSTK